MDAHNVGSSVNANGDGGRRSFYALVWRQIERIANK
jgi:hypothetical protein